MKFKIETTSQDLSAFGGAPIIDEILKQTSFANLYGKALPTLKYKGEEDALLKLKAMVCGLINGCQCLDDMEDCSEDTAYLQLVERAYIRQIKQNGLYQDRKFWVRADSGYYGAQFINSILAVSADVVVRVPNNPGLPKVVSQIHK